ncbi:MAG TPA: peptidoglycan-binding domain-containing protein, partial [Glycomyces sp.]|nr:peptidoglycan-binding domain-containing protein [Glycomyces sp.]
MDLTIRPRADRPPEAGEAGALLPLALPSRRLLLLGVGTLGAGLALGTGAADAAGPTLRKGDRGSAVTTLQKRLNALRYWCGTPDGSFGHLTQQAVFAVQKAAGLGRDGVVGARTWGALDAGKQPSRRITRGSGFEVDLSRQLLILTGGGRIACILNTSTGSGERYYSGGRWKTATTPKGDFRMYRLYSGGWQNGP